MKKRKSTSEFKQEVYDKVGNEYTVLGEYVNNKTKISMRHNCNCCNNNEFLMRPDNFLQGQRCPFCTKIISNNKKKKSTSEFKQEVYDKVGNEYTVLGEYKETNKKIKIRHNTCDHEFEMTPNSFLNINNRCPKCANKNRQEKQSKTTEKFKQEVYDKVGNEYTVLGEYVNSKTKIRIRHNKCNHEYDVIPNNFLRRCNCPKCSINKIKKERSKTIEIVKNEIKKLVGEEYSIISSTYVNTNTKILFCHNICCHEFEMTPNNFLRGNRCPNCSGKMKKTTEKFKQEVYDKVGNEYTVLGEYVNSQTKIRIKHNKCNHEYDVIPNNFLHGNRCPKCIESKGNIFIYNYLKNHNINFIDEKTFNTCKYKNVLSFDFYISHMNLLIEFDGRGHFEPSFGMNNESKKFIEQLKRDQIKNQWAKENNIKLIRISYKDYDKLDEILNEILLTNDFDPSNYDSVYMYSPKSNLIFESGMYVKIKKLKN